MSEAVPTEIEGRVVRLSNLDKVLYPSVGFTKAEVIDYYARIAPVMLGHLAGRCVTFRRFPDGVEGESFFEKRCASHRPDWVRTAKGPGDRRGRIDYCLIEDTPTLVWAANLAALELHTPMARADEPDNPTMVVFDLDPGAPAGIAECAQVALEIREVLGGLDLELVPKSSGSKGLQLYLPLNGSGTAAHDTEHARSFALATAQLLAKRLPALVVTEQTKAARTGKVLIDWSQNADYKTTVCAYSLRARPEPTVSTPVRWEEVADAANGTELSFVSSEVLERVEAHGDLFAPALELTQRLPTPRS